MGPSLPPKASLEQLRKQAKDLLKAHHTGERTCCEVLRRLRQFEGKLDAQVLAGHVSLVEVQYALAICYGFASWQEMAEHVNAGRQIRQRLGHWERFGTPEGWEPTDEGKVKWIMSDPEWKRLVDAEVALDPLSPEARAIRKQIASFERCHEHYLDNVRTVLRMIGSMTAAPVLDCGEACQPVRELAARYARAMKEWQTAEPLPADADDVRREVFELLGPGDPEKQRLVGLLMAKLRDNAFPVYADEDEDFTKVESRIQHLEICNYNWRENLRIVLKEIAAGRRLFPWHAPAGYNAHGDCLDRVAELRPILAHAAAWAQGQPEEEAGDLGNVLDEPTPEKIWLVACLCKNVAAQHAKFGGEQALAKVQLQRGEDRR